MSGWREEWSFSDFMAEHEEEVFTEDTFDLVYGDGEEDENVRPEEMVSPLDALVRSMNQYGRVDAAYMETVTGMDGESLMRDLMDRRAVFPDPDQYDPENVRLTSWLVRSMYVRGNIYALLDKARRMEKKYPGVFAGNIEILKSALPDPPEAGEIYMELGALDIPSYYAQFIQELLGMKEAPEVLHNAYLGKWMIKCGRTSKVLNEYKYGTRRMPAVKIIEHTMNAMPVRVMDPVEDYDSGTTEYVLNRNDTLAAEEKQKEILEAFRQWVGADAKRQERLAEIYAEKFGYGLERYDGSWLVLPDLSEEIQLYPYQKDAIARCIMSDRVLLAHEVGAGKTYEMICSVHELKRMGLSSKSMIVVPNNFFDTFVQEHQRLYPQDHILAVYPKDFEASSRSGQLEKIRRGGYDAIYMAYSSFDMLTMSRKFYLDRKRDEIRRCASEINNSRNMREKKALEAKHKKLRKDLEKLQEELKDREEACFDELGIDLLVLDECHNYKNVTIPRPVRDIVGLHARGSRKCDEMMEKISFVQQNGGRTILASGTPLPNSMTDLFVLQRYLQREELEYCGIGHFSEWVKVFGERDTAFEIQPDSQNYGFKTRFSRFHNLPELMALFSNVCDFYRMKPDDSRLPRFGGYTDIVLKKNELQAMYIEDLVKRTEAIHRGRVDRRDDNLLKVTVDGRKCALDMRLIDEDFFEDETESKVRACADKIRENYTARPGASQIVFCDSSTPRMEFNVYDELRRCLMERGIPKEDIAFIHDGMTERKRRKLLEDLNAGKIRIMVGSTQKLGVGVNVQENLLAIHHLDIPWRPSDMVQREGRLIRQGNKNEEVFIYRYVTEGSFDSYIWQLLENKQKFISSFMEGTMDGAHRTEEDISDMVLKYAEIKALAIGDPLLKKRVETANGLERIKIAQKQRRKQLLELRRLVCELPENMKEKKALIAGVKEDISFYEKHRESVPMEEREALGAELLEGLKANVQCPRDRLFDWYQGFELLLPAHMQREHPYVFLARKGGGKYTVKMEAARETGCCRRLDAALNHLPEVLCRHEEELEAWKCQLSEAKKELQRGNPYDALAETTASALREMDQKLQA